MGLPVSGGGEQGHCHRHHQDPDPADGLETLAKQQQAAEPEEDYGEEDYEDDGPPWDEDENSEEDEE